MHFLLKILSCLLPWFLRRRALRAWFGYDLHPTARIGLAWIFPRYLRMAEHSLIDHFSVAIHLDRIDLGPGAVIGRNNWITGFPTGTDSPHFRHQIDRHAELVLGNSASITKNHHIDCTSRIEIGSFATIAGYQSQFLTHSIDIHEGRQHSAPIKIGKYAFVGTNVVVLGGAQLPDYSVLGAKALLNKAHTEGWTLYGGVPATALTQLDKGAAYFHRTTGFVD